MNKFWGKILLFLLLTLFPACSIFDCSNEDDEEYTFWYCGHPKVERKIPNSRIELHHFEVKDLDTTITNPKLLFSEDNLVSKIKYPEVAKRAGVQGRIFIEFKVDTLGKTNSIKLIKGIGAGCDEAIISVLKNTRFYPATTLLKPVSVIMQASFLFKLDY